MAKMSNSGTPRRLETAPPTRLPMPSPSMNADTTMATDSMLLPKIVSSARCQMSW